MANTKGPAPAGPFAWKEQIVEQELQRMARDITEWAYSGGESRRRAVAALMADAMVAIASGELAQARDVLSRLVVLSRWTTMALDEVAGTLGLDEAERDEIRAGLVEGLVADGHDREHAIEIADQLAANSLWSLDIDESPPEP